MDDLNTSLEKLVFTKYKHLLVDDISRGIFIKQDFTFDEDNRVVIQLGSFARADVWEEVKDELFCVDLAIADAQLHLNLLYIPAFARKKGIAGEFVSVISDWIKSENAALYFNTEVILSDTSPDYDDTKGITTHLLTKHGLTFRDPN